MSRVAAPADRRFRRAHVRPPRRRGRWRAIVVRLVKYSLLAALAIYGAYRGTTFVAYARVLEIEQVKVEGNRWLSRGEVLAVLGGVRGESIVWLDLDEWRRRLLASPWVQDAALRRVLPSTVEVAIVERTPACIGRFNGSLYLVDEHGVVIDEYGPKYAEFDLPIVDGLAANGGPPGANDERIALATQLIAALAADPPVARRLSQIDVSDVHDIAVILTGDPAVIHVGRDRFLERIRSYLQLAPSLRERVPDIDYVDLRFGDRVYVRPAGQRRGGERTGQRP